MMQIVGAQFIAPAWGGDSWSVMAIHCVSTNHLEEWRSSI